MADPVVEAVRRARSVSQLIPKDVLVQRMSRNADILRSSPGVEPSMVELADEAVRDASSIETEQDVIECVRKWIDISSRSTGKEMDFSTGLGSLLMRVGI